MSILSKRLRNKRKDKKLTLAHVAKATGLSISFLSDIERGRAEPSLKTLRTLADFHGVPVDSLLVQAVAALPQDDQARETAISGLRELSIDEMDNEQLDAYLARHPFPPQARAVNDLRSAVEPTDYELMVGLAGDLSGADVGAWEYGL